MSCSCGGITEACTREGAFRGRVQEILRALACQYPSLFFRADFWRIAVVTPIFDGCGEEDFNDQDREVWVRLGEGVNIFTYETRVRFWQAAEGIIWQQIRWMMAPEGLGLEPGDHVVFNGQSFMISDMTSMMGVTKMKIESAKSRFIMPGRDIPTYRQLQVKAAIQ